MIKDDGSHYDHRVLDNVSERLITDMTLTHAYPVGLPKIIEEKYWDSTQEVLLKKVECHYDSQGNLCRQDHYDAQGRFCYSLFWQYDAHGNLEEEINALGHKKIKRYDDNDHLIQESGPRPEDRTEYSYDYADRLIEVKRYSDGKCLLTQHRYDLRGNRVATVDSFGQTTTFDYDELNRLIKTTYPSILITDDWAIAPTLEIEYHLNHQPSQIIEPGGWKTSLTYNARGQPLTKTHPDGTTERFEYNLDGTLAKAIAPNGTSTTYQRDFLGRVLEERVLDAQQQTLSVQTFTYQGLKLIAKVNPEGCLTTYQYDGAGRLIHETCGNADKTYTYDALGRVAKVTQWFGQSPQEVSIQAFEYDFLNRITEERLEDAFGMVLQRVSYTYDELGHKTSTKYQTNAGENLTRVKYQADGKPLVIIDAEGNETHLTYDETHLNSLGQRVLKVIKTDPQGRNTLSIFDALGRLREVSMQDPFQQLLAKQEIFYDPMGRRIKTLDAVIINGEIQRQSINAWRYHASGQEDIIAEAVDTPEQKKTYIFYNAFSQKEKVIKPNGIELVYTYDALGRLKTMTSSDGSIDDCYTYNLSHQVKEVHDRKNQTLTTRHYNALGQLEQETLGHGLQLTYLYDRMGRVTHLTLPDHSSISYEYNAAYLKEVQRYQRQTLLYRHQNTQHDLSGALLQSHLIGWAGELNYSYDRMGRVQRINHVHWLQHMGGYDNVGRLTNMVTQDIAGTNDSTFTYNALDHLQTETGQMSHSYQTDSLHNRLQKNGVPYHLNILNQLQGQGPCRYAYDLNGNLHEKTTASHKTLYQYDALDRLIFVSSPEGVTTYQYDAFHRRLTKTHQGVVFRYLYQGQDEIGCMNAQGEITELRVLGMGIDAEIGAAVALELGGEIYAPVHDRQGHVACLIDSATGQVAEAYRYSAFGEETILNAHGQQMADSQVGNPWRFASKRIDPETGWVYFGRRYYDPEIGRWITPDPVSFADGANLYAYLHHNPLNAYDAYGLSGEAYRQSVEVALNAPHYSVFADLGRSDIQTNEQEVNYIRNASAGIFHGGLNFLTNQICDAAYWACLVGSDGLEEAWDERLLFQAAYSQWQMEQMNAFDHWLADCLCAEPNHPLYQACRSYTTAGLEIGSLVLGGYGLAKAGIECVKMARLPLSTFSNQGAQIAGKIATQELKYALSSGAENVNAGINLSKKLSQLEAAQQAAAKIRVLPDGRVRYYSKEYLSKKEGMTRAACRVTEFNLKNGYSRSWHECYGYFNNVNRIHPKSINGQELVAQHYPRIAKELGL